MISAIKNNQSCFDDGGKFQCVCDFPFAGDRCERDLCEGFDCKNGGTCVKVSGNSFAAECECPENTTGDKCELLSCGSDIPCYNGGTCNGEICQCSQENGTPKYHGQSCDMPAACDGNPCQNDGSCIGKTQINNTQDCFKVNFEHFIQSNTV